MSDGAKAGYRSPPVASLRWLYPVQVQISPRGGLVLRSLKMPLYNDPGNAEFTSGIFKGIEINQPGLFYFQFVQHYLHAFLDGTIRLCRFYNVKIIVTICINQDINPALVKLDGFKFKLII